MIRPRSTQFVKQFFIQFRFGCRAKDRYLISQIEGPSALFQNMYHPKPVPFAFTAASLTVHFIAYKSGINKLCFWVELSERYRVEAFEMR